jgi:hypothetical protein
MEIRDYKVGTSFEIACTKEEHRTSGKEDGKYYYQNFGILKEIASIWGVKPENVITVKATIIEEDVMCQKLMMDENYDSNSIDYFGRISFEEGKISISIIYPNIKQYFICFPYGTDVGLFDKDGNRKEMNVRVKIEELS